MSNTQTRKQILVLTTRKSDSTRRNQMDIIADILAVADCGMGKHALPEGIIISDR